MRNEVIEVEHRIPWEDLLATAPPVGHIVGELLPSGLDSYVRVFHPYVPWDAEPHSPARYELTSWQVLARQAGVPYLSTLTWRQIGPVLPLSSDGQARPLAVWEGELEEQTASALFDTLDTPDSGSYYFAFGLSTIIGSSDHRPMMFSAPSLDARSEVIARVRRLAPSVSTAEYVWPEDQSWIVCTDYDLPSTYVAADRDTAIRLQRHPTVETLEVDLGTRVDDAADEQSD